MRTKIKVKAHLEVNKDNPGLGRPYLRNPIKDDPICISITFDCIEGMTNNGPSDTSQAA